MKRFWALFLLLAVCAVPLVSGCHADGDDDDDATIKVDTKGEKKGIEVDRH